jgi:tRNA dimethylallyltransferase
VKPAIVIVGPTAVGKTELSLEVAKHFDGEIINADSMQLYQGMNIGTAKLSLKDRKGIKHHMLDVLEVTEAANVADYQRDSRKVVNELDQAGIRSVVVGGSGLFIQGLLEDLQFPGSDPEIRDRLTVEAEKIGADAIYQRLVEIDPEAAANILPGNTRRVIRALEVIELTGAAPVTTLEQLPEVIPSIRIGLKRDRAELDERITKRVEVMWEDGLVDEVRALEKVGLRDGLTASKALGYAQVLEALSGLISLDEAKEKTIQATKRFARRQESWFNRDQKIHWFDASTVTFDEIAQLVNKSQ